MRRRAALAAVVTILATAFAACNGDDGPASARLLVQGVAEVSKAGEAARDVDGSRALKLGDRVRVRSGTAVVRLDGDRQLELREGTTVELAAGSRDSVRAELVDGPMLVTASGPPVTVTSSGGEILVTGVARVARTLTLNVATYRGSTEVTSAGRTMSVPVFRQVTVAAAGLLPARPGPVEYVATDPWDQRLLGEAVELGTQLVAKSRGFTSQSASGQNRTPAEFRRLLPGLGGEPAFDALFDPARPAGETLVGAAIVLESKRGGTFEERWRDVFGFRGDGADWGFVAVDHGVDRSAVLRLIDGAIGRAPTPVFAGGTSPTTVPPPPVTVPRGRTPTTTALPPRVTTTSTTLPLAPPVTVPGPLNTGAPVLDDTVNALLETLDSLLRGLSGG